MKIRSIVSLLLLLTWLLPPQLGSQAEATSWIPVDTGIDYQEFHVSGPNNVFVTRMDRHNPYVTLETSLARGRFGTREVITSQAARYDQSINYWTGEWGARSRVVAAINGSYEDPQTIFPDRGVVQSGWYAKRFTDNVNSGFGLKLDGTPFIGGCVSHPFEKQRVSFSNGEYQVITDINAPRGDNQLILYTPQYNSNTLTSDAGVEVIVQMDNPTLIRSTPANASGHVVEIRTNQGSTPIPFDAVVLSASHRPPPPDPDLRDEANFLINHVQVGDVIGISHTIRNKEESKCSIEAPEVDWTETYTSLGGDFHFLNKGTIQPYSTNAGATARAPRTAIAFNNDYIFFIVVDGRNPGVSVGMSMAELGKFAKSQLGAVEGIAEDGGGSSVMVVKGAVRNFPSDGLPRPSVQPQQPGAIANPQSIYLPVINRGQQQYEPLPPPPTPAYPIVERAVVNGFMMVVVEPKELSTAFAPGNQVVTTADPAYIRLGPGTNYAVLTTVSLGTIGTVMEHNLAGVLAKNTHWWKVDYGNGNQGWVPEEALSLLPAQ